MDCSVLPRPMSSHRIPCSLYLFRNANQFTPSCKTRETLTEAFHWLIRLITTQKPSKRSVEWHPSVSECFWVSDSSDAEDVEAQRSLIVAAFKNRMSALLYYRDGLLFSAELLKAITKRSQHTYCTSVWLLKIYCLTICCQHLSTSPVWCI